MLLYIHGFNSSPLSDKGRVTAQFIAQHHPGLRFYQPQLATAPEVAMAELCLLVETQVQAGEPLAYIGSSLGGYYASYLAERYGGRAALINPAVRPFDLFDDFIGIQYNPYTRESYRVLPEHKQQLVQFDTQVIRNPERFLVCLQTGDEVLDYRAALHKYACCQLHIEAGGDHSFVGYEQQLQRMSQFLCLP
ncbi:YqiA/YcfP family alpha/beta fold hydrolase [Shewanella salipaludis]|uniref:Esterase YqiA n=1 Tax=Shewanella salipaludis TaxID=2723052 RepID=A0A972FZ26_9GAMM|nr:YqiA/YcfP family alpha/beta fold hydrolase [Shewanella salipaludis]NMH65297.1 esterase YqiA [Shewanella salipaludis]